MDCDGPTGGQVASQPFNFYEITHDEPGTLVFTPTTGMQIGGGQIVEKGEEITYQLGGTFVPRWAGNVVGLDINTAPHGTVSRGFGMSEGDFKVIWHQPTYRDLEPPIFDALLRVSIRPLCPNNHFPNVDFLKVAVHESY